MCAKDKVSSNVAWQVDCSENRSRNARPEELANSKQDKLVLTCTVSLIQALATGQWELGHDCMEDRLLPIRNVGFSAMPSDVSNVSAKRNIMHILLRATWMSCAAGSCKVQPAAAEQI
jgi:hypothetical protein